MIQPSLVSQHPDLERFLREARRVAALDTAHEAGVLHRGVKSENVMMDRNGRPVLAGFGLALGAEASAATTIDAAEATRSPANSGTANID